MQITNAMLTCTKMKEKIYILVMLLLISCVYAIEGNFIVTGGAGNGTNSTMLTNFYVVSGINLGQSVSYTFGVIANIPVIIVNFPEDGAEIKKLMPVLLNVTYTSPLGDTANLVFYNIGNSTLICQNNSMASGTEIICPLIGYTYGDTITWYVNATTATNKTTTGTLTFTIEELSETGYMAVIILLPILFGLIIIIGVSFMSQEHDVLKFIALPFSIITIIASLHFGNLAINNLNPSMTELQLQLVRSVTWIGRFFIVITAYILLYAIYTVNIRMAYESEDKLKY